MTTEMPITKTVSSYRDQAIDLMPKAKTLLSRLHKGQEIIGQQLARAEVTSALESMRLFNRLSEQIVIITEMLLFISDYLLFGRTIVIGREGKPIKIEDVLGDETKRNIDVWEIESAKMLGSLFGNEFLIAGVEFHN